MKLSEFDYELPRELIAQQPLEDRDASRLMILDRQTGETHTARFRDLPGRLGREDLLVVNNSRVIPARLYGRKGTGALIEILLLRKRGGAATWEALLRPGKRVRVNTRIYFGRDGRAGEARVAQRVSDKVWLLDFTTGIGFDEFLELEGSAPLPPYIRRMPGETSIKDKERYQTLFARPPGSVAAPTAGLHFTMEVLEKLKLKETAITELTLHVGYGTFLPVEVEDVEDHIMEEEFYDLPEGAAQAINGPGRVIAVGTTSTRVIESAADEAGRVRAGSGSTRLFIYPGYRFKRVQGLITNFHLPKSSLFLLAAAFAGKENLLRAYKRAIEERFRFYSYGDCMLII